MQAKPYLADGVVQGLVDPRLGDSYDAAQLSRLMFVASLCVRAAAAWRPTMTQVRTETTNLLCPVYMPLLFCLFRKPHTDMHLSSLFLLFWEGDKVKKKTNSPR
jgi:hypothetical protein